MRNIFAHGLVCLNFIQQLVEENFSISKMFRYIYGTLTKGGGGSTASVVNTFWLEINSMSNNFHV